jgi:NADPH:quinone reductase-like Zn-dependent oxidoreductase
MVGAPKNASRFLLTHTPAAPLWSRLVSQHFVMFIAKMNQEDRLSVARWMATGKVKPIIDKCYRLSEAREAMRYLEQGHARGKVVLTVP